MNSLLSAPEARLFDRVTSCNELFEPFESVEQDLKAVKPVYVGVFTFESQDIDADGLELQVQTQNINKDSQQALMSRWYIRDGQENERLMELFVTRLTK